MAPKVGTGTAYGFFYCNNTKQAIETELALIRKSAETPSELELSLIEGMDSVKGDKELTDLAKTAKQEGMNYALKATYPGGTNRDAADEIASILDQAYQSPLYEANAPFRGPVFYEEEDGYVLKD
ncbi:hypothetical protein KY347_06790 [Candidatus Woesearchaeota archaeon]|nr:hypothetical protein [Candidatus Woesearchaeota archaeon]